jgi:P4 family phage/plasmid primase-like protien
MCTEIESYLPNNGQNLFYNLSGVDKARKLINIIKNYKYCKEIYYYYESNEKDKNKPNNYWITEGKKTNSLITKIADECIKIAKSEYDEIYKIIELNIGEFNNKIYDKLTSDIKRNQLEQARKNLSDEMKVFDKIYKKHIHSFGSSSHSKSLVEFVTNEITDNNFNNNINFNNTCLLPLRNMNLNLKSLKLEERKQEQLFTYIININEEIFNKDINLNDDINYNKVDNFFLKIANGNKEKKEYLQQMLGCFITGEVKTRSFFVWYGDGSNGKSAVMNLLNVVLSEFYKATNPGLIIQKSEGKATDATPQMECLDYGSRLCVLSETKKKDKLNEDTIKNITGGDVISYRPLYGGEKNMKSEAKLVLLTNHKPTFSMTKPMLKRLRYFLFNASFSEEPKNGEYLADPDLCNELTTTLIDYVLLWISNGSKQYYIDDCKLPLPKCMIEENNTLLSDMDTYKLFRDKEIIRTTNEKDRIVQSVAYAKYIEHLSGKGEVLAKFEFFDMMESDFGKTKRINGREYYTKVKLNLGLDDDEDEEGFIDSSGLDSGL